MAKVIVLKSSLIRTKYVILRITNTCGLYYYDVKHQDSFSFCYVCSYALTFFITYHLCKYLELVYEQVTELIKEKHLNVALMIKNVDIGKKN